MEGIYYLTRSGDTFLPKQEQSVNQNITNSEASAQ